MIVQAFMITDMFSNFDIAKFEFARLGAGTIVNDGILCWWCICYMMMWCTITLIGEIFCLWPPTIITEQYCWVSVHILWKIECTQPDHHLCRSQFWVYQIYPEAGALQAGKVAFARVSVCVRQISRCSSSALQRIRLMGLQISGCSKNSCAVKFL